MSFLDLLKKQSLEKEIWTVAIRKRNGKLLYQGNADGFSVLKPDQRYWIADPFVYEHMNSNYLFVEMFDRIKHKGVIGVSRIHNGKCSRFEVCLEMPYHLSYPCIFKKNGEVYMVPECAESGKVTVYRSVDFPLKWESAYDLCDGQYVDTTPFYNPRTGKEQFFTSRYDPEQGGNDNLFIIENKHHIIQIASDNKCVRSAGHVIFDDGIIRPAQDDTDAYGCGLFFYKIKNISAHNYFEERMLRVCTKGYKHNFDDLELNLMSGRCEYIGIHTYNFNDHYEVIDLLVDKQKNAVVLWNNRNTVYKQIYKRIRRRMGMH